MATDEIKRLIASGSLEPGQRILEAQLAEQLGISRPPLREALRVLTSQHTLEATPRRGYRVIALTDEDAAEVADLILLFEDLAVRRIVDRTDLDTTELRAALDRIVEGVGRGDEDAFLVATRTFHNVFIALAAHRRLAQSAASVFDRALLYTERDLFQAADAGVLMRESLARSAVLVDALGSGNAALIRRAAGELVAKV